MVLRQAEAFTTLSGRDSWDMKFLGLTRQPYIKTNYPHHEGIWGWQDVGDQSILVVRSIRWSIDEYHDILADIDYAKTWAHATEMIPNLYKGTVFEVLYNAWRDERTMDEIGWYGWFVDYWMEGGILRDYFDHKLTTPYHWGRLRARSYGPMESCNGTTTIARQMVRSLKSRTMKCAILRSRRLIVNPRLLLAPNVSWIIPRER